MGQVSMRSWLVRASLIAICAACSDIVVPAPTPPVGLAATLSAPTTVQLSWAANPGSERIENYFVFRGGVKIGESVTPTFIDAGLAERALLNYSVVAVSKYGFESDKSSPISITTGDATPPKVLQNVPANGAGPLSVSSAIPITLVFSEAMDSSSINSTTLTVKVASTGAAVPGVIHYNKRLGAVTFTSLGAMPGSSTISVVAGTGIKDESGNGLSAPFTFSFTTNENVPPSIISTFPANGAVEVPLEISVRIAFSERMNASSLGTRIFDLNSQFAGDFVQPSASVYDTVASTQTLTVKLKSRHTYEVVVGPNFPAKDLAGNNLSPPNSFRFTTLDAGPPQAVSFLPAKNAVDVDPSTLIRIIFNEPLDPATVNSNNVRVYVFDGGAPVSGILSYDPQTFAVAFAPAQPLTSGVKYAISLSNLKDATGVAQEDLINNVFTVR